MVGAGHDIGLGKVTRVPGSDHLVLQAPDSEAMVFQVHILDGDSGGLIDPQAVVVHHGKQGPVPGRLDGMEKSGKPIGDD
jgi:hypothetical protein